MSRPDQSFELKIKKVFVSSEKKPPLYLQFDISLFVYHHISEAPLGPFTKFGLTSDFIIEEPESNLHPGAQIDLSSWMLKLDFINSNPIEPFARM